MRIYDPDPATLQALRGSGIELTVGILNMKLRESAATQDLANAWVQNNVVSYGDVRFRNVVVGNEVFPITPDTQQYADLVLPAMRNIRAALNAANLGQIKVTTAVGTDVIDPATNSPSSRGDFRAELKPYLDPIVRFLVETGSPLFASIYPYFAYVNNKQISFDYAFLQPGAGFVDSDGVRYENLYYALADVVNAALEKSTARITSLEQTGQPAPPPEVGGGESGVPTEGETDATSSIENARIYNNNLVQVVKKGTPRRPDKPIETYIFAMFDENEKPGAEIEKHFGLFNSDGDPKYPVNFN